MQFCTFNRCVCVFGKCSPFQLAHGFETEWSIHNQPFELAFFRLMEGKHTQHSDSIERIQTCQQLQILCTKWSPIALFSVFIKNKSNHSTNMVREEIECKSLAENKEADGLSVLNLTWRQPNTNRQPNTSRSVGRSRNISVRKTTAVNIDLAPSSTRLPAPALAPYALILNLFVVSFNWHEELGDKSDMHAHKNSRQHYWANAIAYKNSSLFCFKRWTSSGRTSTRKRKTENQNLRPLHMLEGLICLRHPR